MTSIAAETKKETGFKFNLHCGVRAKNAPKKVAREYIGWSQNMLFIVYRPHGEPGECGEPSPNWDEKNVTVYIGFFVKEKDVAMKPGENMEIPMEQVKVLKIVRNNEKTFATTWDKKKIPAIDNRTLRIETDKGTFYLPDPWTKSHETPTFNGKPIICF